MFCPDCRIEYRPGFDQCADCRVPLVDELAPLPAPPESTAEEKRWELNRTDSLGIAFIQGGLIGYAIGLMLNAVGGFAIERMLLSQGGSLPPYIGTPFPAWASLVHPLLSMLPPMGIVIGGYVARSRRLR
ncbi:MAG: hypothetical protein ACK47B_22360 [Armatimonadota bacterium]